VVLIYYVLLYDYFVSYNLILDLESIFKTLLDKLLFDVIVLITVYLYDLI
jgi:hypothetical protein